MEMYKAQNQQTQRIPANKYCNGKWPKTGLAKANTFGHRFSKVFIPFPSHNPAHDDEVIESPVQLVLQIAQLTQTKVW